MANISVQFLVPRDGRPRWVPSTRLRNLGFKGQDLKDASGNWLSLPEAIAAAQKLNASVEASLKDSEAKTPKLNKSGASPLPASLPAPAARKIYLMKDLTQRFRDSDERFGEKALKTQKSYAYHLRLIDAWAADVPVPALKLQAIEDFYKLLCKDKGIATANAVRRTLRLIMNYAVELEWGIVHNPAGKPKLRTLEGRKVIWNKEEVAAFEAAALRLKLWSVADAVLLACITSQRQGDVLGFESQYYDGACLYTEQQKTKKKKPQRVRLVLPQQIRNRLAAMAERNRQRCFPNKPPATLLVCERTGEPWHPEGSPYRRAFAKVRAEAAKHCPSILNKRFQDLRDTAVTWLAMAGCTIPEIATFTGHDLQTVTQILNDHYFVRDDAMSDAAGAKLQNFLDGHDASPLKAVS